MSWWFEGRAAARTMAVIASADGRVIMNPAATNKSCRGMTRMAVQGGADMVTIHADCSRTIMAGGAIVHDAGMVECCGDEVAGIVTDAAILIGGQMIV